MFVQCIGLCLKGAGGSDDGLVEVMLNMRLLHTVYRGLTTQLFQHLRSSSKSITGLPDRNVKDEFLDTQLPHRILTLVFAGVRLQVVSLLHIARNHEGQRTISIGECGVS